MAAMLWKFCHVLGMAHSFTVSPSFFPKAIPFRRTSQSQPPSEPWILVLLHSNTGSNSDTAADTETFVDRGIAIHYVPCQMEFINVSKQYSVSSTMRLWQQLTSSVPRREWAVANITFATGSGEFLMVTGASSSGKSTLLQTMMMIPDASSSACVSSSSSLTLSSTTVPSSLLPRDFSLDNLPCSNLTATPVTLLPLQRPNPSEATTVEQYLNDTVRGIFKTQPKGTPTTLKKTVDKSFNIHRDISAFRHQQAQVVVDRVIVDLLDCVGLQDGTKRPPFVSRHLIQLTQSELFRLQLICSCLQSMFSSSSLFWNNDAMRNDTTTNLVPAPILLLDEWLDRETTSVIRPTQTALQNLCSSRIGALIVLVTHCPERWKTSISSSSSSSTAATTASTKLAASSCNDSTCNFRHMTLCRGEILSLLT